MHNTQFANPSAELKYYLARHGRGARDFVLRYETKKDFVDFFKKVIEAGSVVISRQAYEKLEKAIQGPSDHVTHLGQKSHLQFLLDHHAPCPVKIVKTVEDLRDEIAAMVAEKIERFAVVFFSSDGVSKTYTLLYFEREKDQFVSFVCNAESCQHLQLILAHEVQKVFSRSLSLEGKLKICLLSNQMRRQYDDISSGLFVVADLKCLASCNLTQIVQEHSPFLAEETRFIVTPRDEEKDLLEKLTYYDFDSHVHLLPPEFFFGDQSTDEVPLKAKVQVLEREAFGESHVDTSFTYRVMNVYTRTYNLFLLAEIADKAGV